MSDVPNITMVNCIAEGNGGDGVRIEGKISVEMKNVITRNNDGQGINIIQHKSGNSIVRDILTGTASSVAANIISQKINR